MIPQHQHLLQLVMLQSCQLLCFPFGAILTPSSAKQLISLSLFSPIDILSLSSLFLLLFSLSFSSFPSSSLILPPSFSFFPLSFLSLFFFPFSHFSSPLFSPVFFLFSVLFRMWSGQEFGEGKSGQVKERRKGKKGKSQEQIMGKIGGASQRETNQVSLFLLPTNKRSIHMGQQNITSVELTRSKTEWKTKTHKEKGCGGEIKSQINVTEHRINWHKDYIK